MVDESKETHGKLRNDDLHRRLLEYFSGSMQCCLDGANRALVRSGVDVVVHVGDDC